MEPVADAEWYDALPMLSPNWQRHWRELHSLDESIVVKRRGNGFSLCGRAACVRDGHDAFYALPTSLWDLALKAVEKSQHREPIAFATKTRIRRCLEEMAKEREPLAAMD
jgi:hypothetical protein